MPASRRSSSDRLPVSKCLPKHAYRTEFHRSRKLIAAARAGALGLRAHGPNRPSDAIKASQSAWISSSISAGDLGRFVARMLLVARAGRRRRRRSWCWGYVPGLHPILQHTVLKNSNRSPIALVIYRTPALALNSVTPSSVSFLGIRQPAFCRQPSKGFVRAAAS